MKVPPARTVAHAKLYTKHTTTDASANKTTLEQTVKGRKHFLVRSGFTNDSIRAVCIR